MCARHLSQIAHLGFLITYFINRKAKSELIYLLSFARVSLMFSSTGQGDDSFQAVGPLASSLQRHALGHSGRGDRPGGRCGYLGSSQPRGRASRVSAEGPLTSRRRPASCVTSPRPTGLICLWRIIAAFTVWGFSED